MSEQLKTLGGQLCNAVFTGASDQTNQVAIQLELDGRPYAFVVLELKAAEKLHGDIGSSIAKIKARMQ